MNVFSRRHPGKAAPQPWAERFSRSIRQIDSKSESAQVD
jgi:hypothetical protein